METLSDRAWRLTSTRPRVALTLTELTAHLRAEGTPVGRDALLGALRRDRRRFRVLEPWRGLLAPLRPPLGGGDGSRIGGDGVRGSPGPDDDILVVALRDPASRRVGLGERVRDSVAHLARRLDERSVRERCHWLALMAEAEGMARGDRAAPDTRLRAS